MIERDEELDRILDDIEQAETAELKAAISGEAVSRQLEQLKRVPVGSEESIRIANRLLLLTQQHSLLLLDYGIYSEAVGLMIGMLAAVLSLRIDPEKVPYYYLNMLLGCIAMCDRTIHEAYGGQPTPEAVHLHSILMNFALLFLSTYEHFKTFTSVKDFEQFAQALQIELNGLSSEDRQFNGQPVTPQMAIDIAYDAMGRLHSCGLMPMED